MFVFILILGIAAFVFGVELGKWTSDKNKEANIILLENLGWEYDGNKWMNGDEYIPHSDVMKMSHRDFKRKYGLL